MLYPKGHPIRADIQRQVAAARAFVYAQQPLYRYIINEFVVEVTDNPTYTASVNDRLVMVLGAPFVAQHAPTPEALGAVLVHEAEHVLRGLSRISNVLHNVAADIALNQDMQREGWAVGPGWLLPGREHLLASMFDLPKGFALPVEKSLEQYTGILGPLLKSSQGASAEGESAEGEGPAGQASPGKGKGNGKADPSGASNSSGVGCGDCGGPLGADGTPEEQEASNSSDYGPADVDRVVQAFSNAAEAASHTGRGNVPGRFIENLSFSRKPPEVNWRAVLRRVVQRSMNQQAGCTTYSLRNPSVGSQLVGCLTAGCVAPKVNLAVIEDTSGSMGSEELVQARNQALNIMRGLGIQEVYHVQADTRVVSEKRVNMRDIPKLAYHGRGGTDFTHVLAHVRKSRPDINLMIYITDGDGPAPDAPPRGVSVVWCIVKTSYARRPAMWGKLVVLDKDQRLLPPL